MSTARPKIFEPKILVYDRPIHPEFFRIVQSRKILHGNYEINLAITNVGHVLSWTDGDRFLTEVIASKIDELPENPLISQSLIESLTEPVQLSWRKNYSNSSRLEEVSSDFFGFFENEMIRNLEPEGLLHRFGYSGRMTLGAISYMGTETRAKRLTIQSIHTFPDDAVYLRTETVIRTG